MRRIQAIIFDKKMEKRQVDKAVDKIRKKYGSLVDWLIVGFKKELK